MNVVLFMLFICGCILLPAYQVQDKSKDAWLTIFYGLFMSAFYIMCFSVLVWILQQ